MFHPQLNSHLPAILASTLFSASPQPAPQTARSNKLLLAGCAVVLGAVMLLVPIPLKGRLSSALMDLVHAPMFALLTWFLLQGLRSHASGRWLPATLLKRILLIAIPLGCCGAGMEWLQALVGRGSSWHDARANFCGAIAGVLLFELVGTNRLAASWKPAWRALLMLGVCALFVIPSFHPLRIVGDYIEQQRQFPLLASFESQLAAQRFVAQDAHLRRTSEFATAGNWALEIELLPGQYSGVFIDGLPGDWSRYQTLSFDLHLDEGPTLDLIVKVFDAEHPSHDYADTDRFDQMFHLTPGMHHLRIPVAEIEHAPQGRFMDLRRIEAWQLFSYNLKARRVLVLDNLRLEE